MKSSFAPIPLPANPPKPSASQKEEKVEVEEDSLPTEPEYAMVTGRVISVSRTMKGKFKIYAVRSNTQYECSCPDVNYYPIQEGDVVEGIARIEGNRLIFDTPPIVQIAIDRDSIVRTMIRVLRKTGFGSEKAFRFFDFLKGKAGSEAKVAGYISELAESWRNNHDPDLLMVYEEIIDGEILKKWLTWWYSNQERRRLYLLGLRKKEIKKIELPLSEIYDRCLKRPFTLLPVSMEKCESMLTRRGKEVTDLDRMCAFVARKIYNYTDERKWVGVPTKLILSEFPQIGQLMPKLKEEYNIKGELHTIYLPKPYRVETTVCNYIEALLKRPPRKFTMEMANFLRPTITEDQKAAVVGAISEPVSIIRGSAGSGKSTVISEIVHNLELLNISYLIVSFTGKAVARVQEILKRKLPMTMHRSIMMNRSKTINPFDVLIIDETSMVTTELFYDFIVRFTGTYSIVFVGDPNQLEPIGWGCLFDQLILSKKVPTYMLTHNHRTNSDGIIANSNLILRYSDGGFDEDGEPLPPFEFVGSSNFFIQPGTRETVYEIVEQLMKAGVSATQVTVITPFNKEIPSLNERISKMFNGDKREIRDSRGLTWRLADRVSLTKNRYDIQLMNGEEGIVVDVLEDSIKVQFKDGTTHTFRLEPTPGLKNAEDDSDDESEDTTGELTVKVLRASFAMTVHLVQGSEYDFVLFYVPDGTSGSSFLNRRLTYTAITRAKKACWLVGDIHAIFSAATRKPAYRCDNLAKRLVGNDVTVDTSKSSAPVVEEIYED